MSRYKIGRLFLFIGLSSFCLLITIFVLSVMGIINLEVIKDITLSVSFQTAFSIFCFFAQMFLVIGIVTKATLWKTLWMTLCFSVLYVIIGFIPYSVVSAIIVPLLFLMFLGKMIMKEDWKTTLKKICCISAYIVITQLMLMSIRTATFDLPYNFFTDTLLLVIQGDFILKLLLYYMVVKFNVLDSVAVPLFLSRKSRRKVRPIGEKNIQRISEVKNTLSKKEFIIFLTIMSIYQIGNLVFVLFMGLTFNVLFEMLVFLFIFFIGRNILGDSWHSNKLTTCLMSTIAIFFFVAITMIPFSYSLSYAIVVSAMFVVILHLVAVNRKGEIK